MKILYEKYNELLTNNTEFIKKNTDYFKRSDSDYSIYINHNFSINEYTKHYYWLNIITYNILDKIVSFLDQNIEEIFPINLITDEDLKTQLEKINNLLYENKEKLTYFKDVEKFIGISIYNKTYMEEKIPDNFRLKKLKPTSLFEHNQIEYNNKYINKNDFMKKHKFIPVNRKPFYITPKMQDDKYYQSLYDINKKPYNSGIYQYYNETNRFIGIEPNFLSYFTLHRVKLNIILYFKTSDNKYGSFVCPSELIDVPIATYDDFKKNIDFKIYFQSYENILNEKNLIFNSLTIYGVIDDICKGLFLEVSFPWDSKKYEKKINRLIYFFLMYLNNAYINFNDIKKYIYDFFKTYDLSKEKLNFITHDNKIYDRDELFEKIFGFLSKVNDMVIKSGDENNIKNNNLIKDLFIENISLYNYEKTQLQGKKNESESGIEKVKYLTKYLKYKKKYLEIKK